MIKYGDLFSGIGCVPMALDKLGIKFEYSFACDIDKHCKKNLLHNFDVKTFYDNVKDITNLIKVDIFSAGFPCQPFSKANMTGKKGLNHKSGDLFTETIRCLKLCQPELFILENVAGLTHKTNREYFDYIKAELDKLEGYKWKHSVLNSKDYGTPQSRKRVYFVGKKNGEPMFPVKCPLLKTTRDIVDIELPLTPYTTKSVAFLEILNKMEEDTIHINSQVGHFGHVKSIDKMDWFYCLTTQPSCIFKRYSADFYCRKLTIDELRSIQNINSNYNNVCSISQFRKQIGNGMDVLLVSKILELNMPYA